MIVDDKEGIVNLTIPIPVQRYHELSVLAKNIKTEIISFFNGDFKVNENLSCYDCPAVDCPGDTEWCYEEFYNWLFNKDK
ncbi:MAG: hypothetical protein FWC06_08705 [Treponema sp.]|nr:hypothetical protein [Treponema sp.]